MPDASLLSQVDPDRPLRWIFLDLNSYFATIEQAENPELRGRPICVVPVMADTSFVIAASVEAKRFGIKTGTQIGDAKKMCPEVLLVNGNHAMYAHYHDLIIDAVETVLPIDKVCSVDEMRFRLLGQETRREEAEKIARRLKQAIREQVKENITCSIGIAPNPFLAKFGTEMMKPDGLVVLEAKDLPDALLDQPLRAYTGINYRMEARLNAAGIFDSRGLLNRTPDQLREAFGSLVGERWWHLLRGYDLADRPTHRRTLGHSHVIPPDHRTDEGSRGILLRLTHKAAARLRAEGLVAGAVHLSVSGRKRSWSTWTHIPPTQDTVTITTAVLDMWRQRAFDSPMKVAITFTDLITEDCYTPSMFHDTVSLGQLSKAVDSMNNRYGKNHVYLASLEDYKDSAQERIAFNKTHLFSEGKDDNDWRREQLKTDRSGWDN